MSAQRVPLGEKHPGFWRRGDKIVFKYRDHRRRQRWGSGRTIAEAKAKKAALETDVRRGEYRQQSRVTFTEYVRAWVDTYQGRTSKRITASTRSSYRRRLEEEAIPFFGEMLLTEIEPQDIKAYAAHVAGRGRRGKRWKRDTRPVSENSVRLALAPVKLALATAFEEGVIRVNPAAGVRVAVPRATIEVDEDEGATVKAMTEEELAAVLDQIAAPKPAPSDEQLTPASVAAIVRWRLFFVVLAHLGVRISELIELRWRDVDLGARTIRIRRKFYDGEVGPPKSRYGRRTLKLTPELARELWELRKETRAGDDALVFTAAQGGRVSPTNLMSRVLKPAARRACVGDWVGFHTFRHTCATLLFLAGWNPKQVQLWLGHHSASFTVDTYVHLLPDDLPEPVALAGGTSPGTQTVRDDPRRAAAEAV